MGNSHVLFMIPLFITCIAILVQAADLVIDARSISRRLICPSSSSSSSIDSIYQFGDSTSDTGNLVRVLPVGPTLPAARLPYGETFPGRPTGRWSDGRLIIDFTAMSFGVPLLNPYLEKNASNFRNGVNFAVAGATALNSSFFSERGITVAPSAASLSVQLSWFRTFLTSICSTPAECSNKLRRSIVFVGEIGSNDINFPLTQGKSLEEIQTYVPSINEAIINTTREIILMGASRVVVPGNFPIGCFPYAISLFALNSSSTAAAYDEMGCIKSLNNLAKYQNNNLQLALNTLRSMEFPNVEILYADYYNAFLTTFRLAPLFGFDRTTLLKACCGNGPIFEPQGPQFCGNPGVPVCAHPNRYIHWDGLHLTQEAHRRISQIIVTNMLTC